MTGGCGSTLSATQEKIMKTILMAMLFVSGMFIGCSPIAVVKSRPQLTRESYVSRVDSLERDFFVYLPAGYEDTVQKWPVLLFLNGDGERGDGKADLEYVLKHGPLYEAWIQKRDLSFIIVGPQLHMFGRDGPDGPDYIRNRNRSEIPQRLAEGIPPHSEEMPALELAGPMVGAVAVEKAELNEVVEKTGWHKTDPDVITILDTVLAKFQADTCRVYLTGLSMGGYGTWFYAARYPEKFAAILPIVGYPTPEQAEAVAKAGIPAWCFSGGRDIVVPTGFFFPGMNKMEENEGVMRFTTEQDMFHDVWIRVYGGDDAYNWLLQYRKK
jgi:predicted peptidase